MKASGPHSGELWQVAPFTYDDLLVAAPAQVGPGPIGADLGAVAQGDAVSWALPPDLVSANASAFFGVFPVSSDGVDYWNLDGMEPPRLIISYH